MSIHAEVKDCSDTDLMSVSKASEEMMGSQGLKNLVCRSDSESSWSSWDSSDGSSPDIDKEKSERLWDFFSSPEDPYNPMFFTACTISSTAPQATPFSNRETANSDADTEEKESTIPASSEDDEEQLWKSLCQKDDPYDPLNFQACLQSSPKLTVLQDDDSDVLDFQHTPNSSTKGKKLAKAPRKPVLPERHTKHHSHPETIQVPLKRSGQTPTATSETKKDKADNSQKKVRFSPVVKVHVMRTWPFARRAARKGHWEEMARDRDCFGRQINQLELVIGQCFTQPHREKMRAYLDSALKKTKGS